MKNFPQLLLLLHLSAAAAAAQSTADTTSEAPVDKIRYQLILPEEKTPEVVKPNEPNPFNKGESGALKAEDSSSEENKVKEVMLSMRSSGVVVDGSDGNVRSVMLGPMKLERNMLVPPVLSDQEVRLRVNSLSDSAIELFWVEKKKNTALPPRPVIIPINIKPAVRIHLPTAGMAEAPKGDAKNGGNRNYGLQTQAEMTHPAQPPAPATAGTPPRAIPVDETGTSQPDPKAAKTPKKELAGEKPSSAPPAPPAQAKPGAPQPPPEEHPANLLMKLLMDKAMPTQQQQPQVK